MQVIEGVGGSTYQMAGHNQSPLGIRADTSTRPYLIVFLPAVVSRADRTGLMIWFLVELLTTAQGLYSWTSELR